MKERLLLRVLFADFGKQGDDSDPINTLAFMPDYIDGDLVKEKWFVNTRSVSVVYQSAGAFSEKGLVIPFSVASQIGHWVLGYKIKDEISRYVDDIILFIYQSLRGFDLYEDDLEIGFWHCGERLHLGFGSVPWSLGEDSGTIACVRTDGIYIWKDSRSHTAEDIISPETVSPLIRFTHQGLLLGTVDAPELAEPLMGNYSVFDVYLNEDTVKEVCGAKVC